MSAIEAGCLTRALTTRYRAGRVVTVALVAGDLGPARELT